jgi:hypothetical protein
MMALRASLLLTVVVLTFSTLGCGGDPPNKEIQQAQTAIDAARAAGADRYAVEEYTAATTALTNANLAVEQRDYRLALNHALDSLEHAQAAGAQASGGKAAARASADLAVGAAAAAVAAAEAKVKAAEAAHVAARSLMPAQAALTAANQRVQEARTAFANGDYPAATDAASAATAAAKDITEKIPAPTAPPARRRPASR